MSEVLSKVEDDCLWIRLNRPERLNAVNEGLYQGLMEALGAAETDKMVRAIVIEGAGRSFCAGADLKAHGSGTRTAEQRSRYVHMGQRACEAIQLIPKPVVAKVHGYALGGGAEIATSCDLMVMADDASIGFPEASIGTYVGGGVTHRLPRMVGLARARAVLMIGDRLSGEEAVRVGLAYASSPPSELDELAVRVVGKLASNGPVPMAKLKRALAEEEGPTAALASEADDLLETMLTDDWAEGVAAFAEKRTPRFKGQ